MLIDKISLTFPITDEHHQKYIAGEFIDLPKELDCGWIASRGGAYRYAARLHAPLPKGDLQGSQRTTFFFRPVRETVKVVSFVPSGILLASMPTSDSTSSTI